MIKDGDYILTHTQDELLHALRIECKKLRYLMEFFTSLFPRKKMTRLIKQLKRLQDNLGEFNDLSVQQEYLMHMAEELPIDEARSRKALVATGYLVENLGYKQKRVKANFADTFTEFASPANQKRCSAGSLPRREERQGRPMTTLALYSNKGGVGKTAAAVNLGYLAARSGLTTLICDLDPQASTTFYFRVKPKLKPKARGLVRGANQ